MFCDIRNVENYVKHDTYSSYNPNSQIHGIFYVKSILRNFLFEHSKEFWFLKMLFLAIFEVQKRFHVKSDFFWFSTLCSFNSWLILGLILISRVFLTENNCNEFTKIYAYSSSLQFSTFFQQFVRLPLQVAFDPIWTHFAGSTILFYFIWM